MRSHDCMGVREGGGVGCEGWREVSERALLMFSYLLPTGTDLWQPSRRVRALSGGGGRGRGGGG